MCPSELCTKAALIMLVLESLLPLLTVSACKVSFARVDIKGNRSTVNIINGKGTFIYIVLHCKEGVKFQRTQTAVLSKVSSMAAEKSLSWNVSGCRGIVCTDLGWKQQADSQSVWPDPVRSTLPFGRPTIFQRWSSLQQTRMSLQGCMTMLHRRKKGHYG